MPNRVVLDSGCSTSCYDRAQADAPSRPNGLSGATPGQHVELSKHRMSLTARCADQLTQSQTRWSVRCVPVRAIRKSFSHSLVRSFPRIRRPKAMWKYCVPLFIREPTTRRLRSLAERTITWTSTRPQPRLKALVQQLRADPVLQRMLERHVLRLLPLIIPPNRMRPLFAASSPVRLETVRDLADWLRLDPEHLLWFADLRDRNVSAKPLLLNHYTARLLAKPYGTVRLVEVPKQRLKSIQRQVLHEILAPIPLHPAVHGFCKGRSIVTFASPHVAREAVLRLDLQDFFPSISGPRIQALFRTLGYPEPVADLLGGLCTTTAPRWSLAKHGMRVECCRASACSCTLRSTTPPSRCADISSARQSLFVPVGPPHRSARKSSRRCLHTLCR